MQPSEDKKKIADDDRNLVVVDKDFAEADIEDHVWLFWKRNRGTIVTAFVLIAAILLGSAIYRTWRSNRTVAVQNAYVAAATPEALDSFAQTFAGEPLAAVAALQVADAAYTDGRFEEAARRYAAAAQALTVPEMAQRAQLGAAVALIRAGKDADCAALKAVAQNAEFYDAIRAQAAYQLALLAAQGNRFQEAYGWLEQLGNLPYAGIWAQRAQTLIALKPEILKAERESAAAQNPPATVK